jgi:hypothetical protein
LRAVGGRILLSSYDGMRGIGEFRSRWGDTPGQQFCFAIGADSLVTWMHGKKGSGPHGADARAREGEEKKGFRRLKAFKQLPALRAALAATPLPKRRRPLNVNHGSARSAKFDRARGNSAGRATFGESCRSR